jgi:hypothetical protein
LQVNLWGVINGSQAFVGRMAEQKTPGFVWVTGSKQSVALRVVYLACIDV